MCPRDAGLGEQRGGRSLLRVCEGHVETHAAGSRGPDLQVYLRLRQPHAVHQHLDVPYELRQVQGREVRLDVGDRGRAAAPHQVPQLPGGGEQVLVCDRRRRVYTVDHDLGPVRLEHRVQQVPPEVLFLEMAQQIVEDLGPAGVRRQHGRPRVVAPAGAKQDVSPLRYQIDAFRGWQPPQSGDSLLRFLPPERRDHEARWSQRKQLAGHGDPDQAGTAQHQDVPALYVHFTRSCSVRGGGRSRPARASATIRAEGLSVRAGQRPPA